MSLDKIIMLIFILSIFSENVHGEGYNLDRVVSEKLIAKIDDFHNVSILLSPDSSSKKRYQEISDLTFSPDSNHTAYRANDGGKEFVVHDGKELKKYGFVGPDLVFSPNSNHIAYTACDNGTIPLKYFVVIDDKELNNFRHFFYLLFSKDSDHLAYEAEDVSGFNIVEDNKSGKIYRKVDYLTFSPDGNHLAYSASPDIGTDIVVLDSNESSGYDWMSVGKLSFSPDSQHFGYLINENDLSNDSAFVVID